MNKWLDISGYLTEDTERNPKQFRLDSPYLNAHTYRIGKRWHLRWEFGTIDLDTEQWDEALKNAYHEINIYLQKTLSNLH